MQNEDYISRFSHELRNPLTLISSSLQLLEKECPAVRESELWAQIQKDMADVIQLLKDMSAPFGGIRTAPVNLAEFLSGLSASFAPSMEMRRIRFLTELPDSPSGPYVMADTQKLRQALTNLLINAADAVSASGRSAEHTGSSCSGSDHTAEHTGSSDNGSGRSAPGTVILSVSSDGTEAYIHVRDNGPGIPQEYLPDLFEPFVTHKPGGTGLGLSTAGIIAEQHKGALSVNTCHGDPASSYTDFCLRLPLCGSAE